MAFCTNCGSSMEGQFCPSCGTKAAAAAPEGVQPVAPSPEAVPAPKKSNVLVWALAGCGGLIALGLIAMALFGWFVSRKASEFGKNPAFAAAKMMAAMNPEVEVIRADEDSGQITLREKKSGKTITLDFRDIQKGRMSFEGEGGEKVDIQTEGEGATGSMTVKGPEGTMQFGQGSLAKVPGWVPKYPGAQVVGTATVQGEGKQSGTFHLKCSGSVEQIAAYYEQQLKGAGMQVQRNSMQSGSQGMILVTGTDEASRRTVNATVTSNDQGTVAQIFYEGK